jgi:hypothetical protein
LRLAQVEDANHDQDDANSHHQDQAEGPPGHCCPAMLRARAAPGPRNALPGFAPVC